MTINLPAFSGRLPTTIAADKAAPEDIPDNKPSSLAYLRPYSIASASSA